MKVDRRATSSKGRSTVTPDIEVRSIMTPPSQVAVPAVLWAPPRTATSSPCSRAKPIAAETSRAESQQAITAGRLSISAFQTRRASSKSGSPGTITVPSVTVRSPSMP